MPDQKTLAFEALVTAIHALDRYGSDHRVARQSSEKAIRLLNQVMRTGDDLIVVFSEDRIIVGGSVINDARKVAGSLGPPLRALGFQTLRVRQGVDRDDIARFTQDMLQHPAAQKPERIGTSRLSAGTVSDGERTETPACPALIGLCGPLADLHSGILNESRIKSGELENIAEAVLCSFTNQSSAVLELVEIENHDQYTMAHSVNVSVLAGALARSIGASDSAVEKAVIAALLHDIGKREIPSSILLKNGPLSDRERRVVLNHPAAGARMLFERDDIPLLASVVAYEHHRRLDKRGYPEPASATTPSVASQIVQIADIYDALRSHRPYRRGMPIEKVIQIMSNDAGKAYDRALFETFVDRVLVRTDHARNSTGLDSAA